MSRDGARARGMPRLRAALCALGMGIILFFHWIHCRWQLIRPAWFSVLIVVLLTAAFLNDQAQDVLVATAEDDLRAAMLFLGLLVFSVTAWYCARANLYVDYKFLKNRSPAPRTVEGSGTPIKGGPDRQWCPPLEPEEAEAWRRHLPRLLGMAVPLCVGLVYLGHSWRAGTFDRNAWLGVLSLVLAAILYGGFVGRRYRIRGWPGQSAKLPPNTYRVLRRLLLAFIMVAVLVVALPSIWPETAAIPVWLGSPFLILLAAASWVAVGSFALVYPTYRFRLTPSLVLVALLTAGVMNWLPWRSSDHRVRSFSKDYGLTEEFASWAHDRPDIQEQFGRWLEARATALPPAIDDRDYPVFVLAAEGGGIRAAYWTAAVLAEIEDRVPGFACHVFAISGVSGGSLGAATYAGLIADKASRGEMDCARAWFQLPSAPPFPWVGDEEGRVESPLLLSRATLALEQDFLAPALAGLLYPDTIQRFLPVSLVSLLPDRATYLEKAWEDAWAPDPRFGSQQAGCSDPERARAEDDHRPACNWMRAPFNALWRSDTATLVPSLFLNTTEVETGQRLILSNLRLPEPEACDPEKRRSFGAATDAFARACPATGGERGMPPISEPIRLSTAAGLSARFTYVSPPARLHNNVRVVDGGYYENGGVLTAHDVLHEIQESIGYRNHERQLRVVVITLVNSTFDDGASTPEPGRDGWLASTFHETWAPVAALLATRAARGEHAIVELRAALPGTLLGDVAAGHMHRFGLQKPGCRLTLPRDPSDKQGASVRTFPLGWMLAPSTAEEIAFQAKDAVVASLTPGSGWLARYAQRMDEPVQEFRKAVNVPDDQGPHNVPPDHPSRLERKDCNGRIQQRTASSS